MHRHRGVIGGERGGDDASTMLADPTEPTGTPRVDDMLLEEVERARSFSGIIAFLCLFVLCFVPFLGGPGWLQVVMAATMVVFGVSSFGVRLTVADPRNYTRRLFRAYGAVAVWTALVIQTYLGVFSPTPLAVVLGIGFFAQGRDRVGAWSIAGAAAATTLLLSVAVASGLLPDWGVIDGLSADPVARWFFVAVVPIVMSVTLLQGRANHVAMRALHRRVQQDAIEIAAQEARLGEVRAELEVLRAPIGRGAHTGTLAGRFQLGEVLGRGGVGEVYLATDGERRAAVKVLRPSWANAEDVKERFQREAALGGVLDTEHIVELYGQGTLSDGTPWFAMEYLDGRDLAEHLRDQPVLPLEEVGPLVQQVAAGLEAAHRAGVIHRDVKPRNLIRQGETWKILDFGVARLVGPGATLTAQGVVGTPNYMSPEQARSEAVDSRTDLFALGSVIYRCLLGQAPFSGPTPLMTIYRVAERRPVRPRALRPGLSRDLEAFLAVALAPGREDRFHSASELAEVFQQAAAGRLPARWKEQAEMVLASRPWERP